jgi:polypeptide N-acetylgalactosaminyltransferase
MARLQLRRIVKNVAFFTAVLLLYILYSSEEKKYMDPIKGVNKVEQEPMLQTLLVDEFWVPEKAFLHLYRKDDPGEMGHPVSTSSEDSDKRREAYRNYGFNQFVSDRISLNRTIPDTRPKE